MPFLKSLNTLTMDLEEIINDDIPCNKCLEAIMGFWGDTYGHIRLKGKRAFVLVSERALAISLIRDIEQEMMVFEILFMDILGQDLAGDEVYGRILEAPKKIPYRMGQELTFKKWQILTHIDEGHNMLVAGLEIANVTYHHHH
jgi:hypothetical protein